MGWGAADAGCLLSRALDAVQRVQRLVNSGHRRVVDGDLSNYFGEIPHAEPLRSVACRVSDGHLLGWVKRWLEMAAVEDDGKGGQRRTNQARRDAARGPGLPVAEQCLHAAVHPGVEDAGPCPADRRGNRQLRGRLRDLRAGTGGSDAGGGRADDGAAAVAAERDEDPLLARAGGAAGVPRVPRGAQ